MKKGNILFIAIGFGICFMIGVFVGRSSVGHHIFASFDNATFPTETTSPVGFPGNGKIDLNTATEEQLMLLPGIGEKLSKRIVKYRQTNGPFTKVEDLLQVEGIHTSVFAEIVIYLTVGGTYENFGS